MIITSAYSEYALDAFDLDVRDYLMKSISFERFLKAIGRITPRPDARQIYQLGEMQPPAEDAFAFFNVNKTKVKVKFNHL